MVESYKTYTGNGVLTTYAPVIAYLDESHIKVYLDDAPQSDPTHYAWTANQIVFVTAPPTGAEILFQRVTPRAWGDRGVDFSIQTFLDKGTLDVNQQWIWYIMQESHETDDAGKVTPTGAEYIRWNSVRLEWDARRSAVDKKIGGVADPAADDDVANKGYVDSIAEFGVGGVPDAYDFTGDGSTKTFNLTNGANIETNMCIVTVENAGGDLVFMQPTTDYQVIKKDPTSDISFTVAPADGKKVVVINLGKQRTTGTGAGTITEEMLETNAVSNRTIVDLAVTSAKLAALAVTTAKIAAEAVTTDKIGAGTILKSNLDLSGFTAIPSGSTDEALMINEGNGNLDQRVLVAADITNIASWLADQSLSQMTVPTGNVSWNSKKITNLDTPTAGGDAATKDYVDILGSTNESQIVRVYNHTLGSSTNEWDFTGWDLTGGYEWYELVFTNIQLSGNSNVTLRYKIGSTWHSNRKLSERLVSATFAGSYEYPNEWRCRITSHEASGQKMNVRINDGFVLPSSATPFVTGTVTNLGISTDTPGLSYEFNTGIMLQVYGGKS
jgi:hypothetical protein